MYENDEHFNENEIHMSEAMSWCYACNLIINVSWIINVSVNM